MSISRVAALFSLFVSPFLFNTESIAQEGTLHGAAITARPGGGCFYTATGKRVTNPFVEPSYSGAIYCIGNLQTTVTYQGSSAAVSTIGTVSGEPEYQTFQDNLGNSYSSAVSSSQLGYCGGSDCYPSSPQDMAKRTLLSQLNLQNLVKAVNAKDEPNQAIGFRVAYAYTADGYTTGFNVEGGKLMLEMAKDEKRSFEIFPSTSGAFDKFSDPVKAPYEFKLVVPDLQRTPHKENVEGISTVVQFDQSQGRWRYFIYVDGSLLPSIGKYMVPILLKRTAAVPVSYRYATPEENQRFCNPTSRCDHQIFLETMATLTVAYGTEQCFKQQGQPLPSISPLVDSYLQLMARLKKIYRPAFKILNKLAANDRRRILARKVQRQLTKDTIAFVASHKAYEAASMKELTELYTAEELGAVAQNLQDRAFQMIAVGKKFPFATRRQVRNASRAFGLYLPTKAGSKKASGKVKKQIATDLAKVDTNYNDYRQHMTEALVRDSELRQNSQICGEVF